MKVTLYSPPPLLYAVGVLRSFEPPKTVIRLMLDVKKAKARKQGKAVLEPTFKVTLMNGEVREGFRASDVAPKLGAAT